MTIEIKNPVTKAKLEKAYQVIRNKNKKKGFNPDQFLGKIKWGGDGVTIQKQMRDEWL
jgi:hypothetical protein